MTRRARLFSLFFLVVGLGCADEPNGAASPVETGSTRPDASVRLLDSSVPASPRTDASFPSADVPVADDGGHRAKDSGPSSADATTVSVDEEGGECPSALVGWATVAGDGVSATTGGGNAAPVRPKTAAELLSLAADPTPRVIEIAGSFDVPALLVASNKTLLGIGKDATLRGGVRIRGKADAVVSNVILRNLRVDGAKTAADGDAVQVIFAHHVWVDHCEIWDGPDGNLDLTHATNWVTVSWTKVRYSDAYVMPSGESKPHRFASLVGHSDSNAAEDDGRLKVSFHHNWWAEQVIERMPRVRFGQVHVFNNYFAARGNNYCVRAGRGAHVLVEGNYFEQVNDPHVFNSDEDKVTANITARDNVYDQASGEQASGGGGAAFATVPYDVELEPAASVPARVRACAGPR
jgi:pectate lyase